MSKQRMRTMRMEWPGIDIACNGDNFTVTIEDGNKRLTANVNINQLMCAARKIGDARREWDGQLRGKMRYARNMMKRAAEDDT